VAASTTSEVVTKAVLGDDSGVSNDIPISLKATLVDSRGVAWRDFRRTLRPRYGRVWRDIALGYAGVVAVLVVLGIWGPELPVGLLAAAAGALLIGYALAYLNNFFHEATHYNLLPDRRWNDLATNLLMGWIFGSSIATYRKIHFQHHRALGTTEDSENSYFDPLGTRYLVEGLFGLKAIRSLRRYRAMERRRAERRGERALDRSRFAWLAGGIVLNAALVAALWLLVSPVPALAWAGGVLLAFPFFVSLRQALEHRSEDADPHVDYTRVDHGPVNRLFGDGPVSSSLGGAGFNRHALHHWEPTVSYTRLSDIEAYLMRTEAADLVRSRSTSYPETFLRLFEL
jgi:fatty acid desaturase